jgi:hypothetical protein
MILLTFVTLKIMLLALSMPCRNESLTLVAFPDNTLWYGSRIKEDAPPRHNEFPIPAGVRIFKKRQEVANV